MIMSKYIYVGGKKAVTLNDLDGFLDYLVSGGEGGKTSIKEAHKIVPWLYRGTDIRKNSVAGVPFKIYQGETEIDSSTNYQNAVGFLPNPFRLLREIEGSLTLTGRAYLWNTHNNVRVLGLRYLVPTTVKPRIDQAEGLVGWERNTGHGWRDVPLEDIAYLWGDDTYVELGPPESAPGVAALIASGLLISIDEFATKFAERGMIKATLIKVPKGTDKDERSRIRKWWKSRVLGVGNTGAVETMEADAVEVHTIGEGLSELAEVELTAEKRQDVSAALGVPATKLFSGEASGLGGGGVVAQDDINFYKETILPECIFIAAELNRQVFTWGGMDYTMRFLPETMDIFQADEAQRAGAVKTYWEAGYPLSVASEILGVDLPEGIEYSDLDTDDAESQESAPPDDGKALADERRWRSVSLRQLKAKKSAAYNFESEHIAPARHAQIINALEDATTAEEVKAAFAARFQDVPFYP